MPRSFRQEAAEIGAEVWVFSSSRQSQKVQAPVILLAMTVLQGIQVVLGELPVSRRPTGTVTLPQVPKNVIKDLVSESIWYAAATKKPPP